MSYIDTSYHCSSIDNLYQFMEFFFEKGHVKKLYVDSARKDKKIQLETAMGNAECNCI